MQVRTLHALLSQLIEKGHGHKPVCINKSSFYHALEEDGAVILDVHGVSVPRFIPTCDPDGGTKWNVDGSESGRTCVVLHGGYLS
jgi:hypothetical protein